MQSKTMCICNGTYSYETKTLNTLRYCFFLESPFGVSKAMCVWCTEDRMWRSCYSPNLLKDYPCVPWVNNRSYSSPPGASLTCVAINAEINEPIVLWYSVYSPAHCNHFNSRKQYSKWRYNAVQYNKILYKSLQELRQNINQRLDPQTPIPRPSGWAMGCL